MNDLSRVSRLFLVKISGRGVHNEPMILTPENAGKRLPSSNDFQNRKFSSPKFQRVMDTGEGIPVNLHLTLLLGRGNNPSTTNLGPNKTPWLFFH